MFELRRVMIVLSILVVSVLVGCGGSGGVPSDTPADPTAPPPSTERTLTGKVIGSLDSAGVPNIVIRLGDTDVVAKTDSSGVFVFSVAEDFAMPVFFAIDTTEQAGKFPPGDVVRYNDQIHLPSSIDIALSVLNGDTTDLGVVTLYDIRAAEPAPLDAVKNTILTGRVVSAKTGTGVGGVAVSLGSDPKFVVTTGKNGYFSFDLGLDMALLGIYPSTNIDFSINSSGAGSSFPITLAARYNEIQYSQADISLSAEVVAGESTDLGIITLLDDGSGTDVPPSPPGDGGDTPPPPPIG